MAASTTRATTSSADIEAASVILTGLVPPERVPAMIRAMDVLAHPSYREGLARALPQSLLAAKPVISYDCDGAAEVAIPNQTGFLVKTGDAPGLLQAMLQLASNRPAAAAMGQTGRQLCLQKFSSDVMVDQIESLYRRLAGDAPP